MLSSLRIGNSSCDKSFSGQIFDSCGKGIYRASAKSATGMLQAGRNERLKSAVQMARLILTSTFFKTRLLTAVSHSVAKRRFRRLKSWHFFIAGSIGMGMYPWLQYLIRTTHQAKASLSLPKGQISEKSYPTSQNGALLLRRNVLIV